MTKEQISLPTVYDQARNHLTSSPSRQRRSIPVVLLFSLLGFIAFQTNLFNLSHHHHHDSSHRHKVEIATCPAQPPARNIGSNWNPLEDNAYAELAAARLSRSVQIETESYDNLPQDPTDPAFDKHYAFAHFLEVEFPKIYKGLQHESVNTHAHLFTWEGKNASLQPILLLAHIDTVPVLKDTLGLWTFPPFEGKVSKDATANTPGTWIWGRGASDCKNSLMGILGAVERLVTEGFTPERSVILAFGFDEEIGGQRGAGHLGQAIEKKFGPDSISFIIDEGFSGLSTEYGAFLLSMGMAEKGSLDVGLTVETPGGHSSVPPAHTGIGIMSQLINALEANPYEPTLDPRSPYLKYLTCLAEYAPEFPKSLKRQIKDPRSWKKLAKELAASSRLLNSFLATTQAFDLISGGVKVNALPEVVTSTVNHRISFTSSSKETKEHISSTLKPLAKKLGFTISLFASDSSLEEQVKTPEKSSRHIIVDQRVKAPLEPAPITPAKDKSFALLAGTGKAIFGDDLVVTPTGMYANTDTRHYWNLTTNLYRFTPTFVSENLNQHTVDERISLNGHLNTTRYYYKLIRNLDGWLD